MNETPPAEVPAIPPAEPTATENIPAPPPAARLVVEGVKSEREIELERQLSERDEKLSKLEADKRKAEFIAAEKEDEAKRLREIPAAPRAPKPKKSNWLAPIIGSEDE